LTQILDGIKVADFGWAIAGPYFSRYLADHGATVIRIESEARPCIARVSAPFACSEVHINRSGYFARFNSSKYSVALDLNHPRGPEVARKIISLCDIVSENFAPGIMKRWGLDYQSVSQTNPGIIYISSSNLGQTGPSSHVAAAGTQLVSLSGFTHLTGWPDRVPSQPYGGYTDTIAPRFGVAAIVAALDYRRRTGKGQYIDTSQLEAALHFISPLFLDHFANGKEAVRSGNKSPTGAPHNAYMCQGQDRCCVIAIETEEQWGRFCHVIGNPSWTREPKFATLAARKQNEAELDSLVGEWAIHLSAEEVMEKLQSAGVPAGVVSSEEDICNDPQLQHRRYFQQLDHPEIGPFNYESHPFRFSKTPAQLRSSPCLGQHTEYILKEVLGFPEEEYVELLLSGVFR